MRSRAVTLRHPIISGALFAAVLLLCAVRVAPEPTTHLSASSPTVPTRPLYVIIGFPGIAPEYIGSNIKEEKKLIAQALGGDESRVVFRKKDLGEDGTCNPTESCDVISVSDITPRFNNRQPCNNVPGTGERCYFRYSLYVECSGNDSFVLEIPSTNPDPERRAFFVAERVASSIKYHDKTKHSQ